MTQKQRLYLAQVSKRQMSGKAAPISPGVSNPPSIDPEGLSAALILEIRSRRETFLSLRNAIQARWGHD